MANMRYFDRRRVFMLMLMASAMPTPAMGQDTAEPTADTIVVTGSRIRRDPLNDPAPVTILDRADIERSGTSSIGDFLQRLPSNGGGLNSSFNRSGNNGNPPDGGGVGAGSSEIDIRYLGSRRTLVLVDGMRFINGAAASGIPGAVDLNAIPDSMVERIDVLRDGASTIYGSDAVAGVVNIITKTRQKGFIGSAYVGTWGSGRGTTQNYQVNWGNGGSGGPVSVVAGGNFVKQDKIFASGFPTPGATSCDSNCSGTTPNGRFIFTNPSTGKTLALTLKSNPIASPRFDPADPTGANSDFKAFTNSDRYNYVPPNYVLTPQERIGAFVNFSADLGNSVRLLGKVIYNRRTSENQAAPLPVILGPDAGNGNLLDTVSIDATNPYNPFGITLNAGTNGSPANYQRVARRFTENGPRNYRQTVNTMYMGATLEGQFELGAGTWYWDVNGVYSENNAKQVAHGNVNAANLARAVGPISACTGSCVPLNLFGGEGTITQAMLDYVAFTQRDRSDQTMTDATLNISGPLFRLPAGDVSVAAGYEFREQTGSFTPDPIVAAGLGSDIPAQPSAGRFTVHELYGELNATLFKDLPMLRLLEGSFAARRSDYSTSGAKTVMKAGLNWKPFNDLRLRGTWAQGFRAPSIGELFGTPSRFDGGAVDPCSDFNHSGVSETVRRNCISRGVPANGSYIQSDTTLPVLTGGNRNLRAETSESWIFGGVYSPGFMISSGLASRFSVEVDYYTIRVEDAIASVGADVLLANCANINDPVSCASVTRSASGQVTQIRGLLQNISSLKSAGIDLTLNYRSPQIGSGTIGLTALANYLLEYSVTLPTATGTEKTELQGTQQGGTVYSRIKGLATLDWKSRDYSVAVIARYLGSAREPGFNNSNVPAVTYLDAQIGWNLPFANRNFTLSLGMNNVLATNAPNCLSCAGLNLSDRFTYARISAKF